MNIDQDFDDESIAKERELRALYERLAMEEEVEDLKWMMKNRRGRRIVWRELERARVFHSSFSSDPLVMAKREGFKEYGYHLLQMIHAHSPENYSVMVEEASDRKRRYTASSGASRRR